MDDLDSLLAGTSSAQNPIKLSDDGEAIGELPIPEKPKRIASVWLRTRQRLLTFAIIAIPTTVVSVVLIVVGLTLTGIWNLQYLTMPDPRPCIARLSSPKLAFSVKSNSNLQSGIYLTDMTGSATCLVSNITDATKLAWSSSLKRIDAITDSPPGDDQVYTIDLGGLSRHLDIQDRPSGSGQHIFKPFWSPDGTKLMDGKNIINLETNEYHELKITDFVSWSPDSQHIIYFPNYSGDNSTLNSMNINGSDVRFIASNVPDRSDMNQAFWLPDEQHVVYWDASGLKLYDGLHTTLIAPGGYYFSALYPSPDGTRLVTENYLVSIIDISSKTIHQLTLPPLASGSNHPIINWSPDSRYFAYVSVRTKHESTDKPDNFSIITRDGASIRLFPVQGGNLISNIIWIQ